MNTVLLQAARFKLNCENRQHNNYVDAGCFLAIKNNIEEPKMLDIVKFLIFSVCNNKKASLTLTEKYYIYINIIERSNLKS